MVILSKSGKAMFWEMEPHLAENMDADWAQPIRRVLSVLKFNVNNVDAYL